MNKTNLIFLLILICCTKAFCQKDYILGVIEYERKYGTELEKTQSRKNGFEKIRNEANRGYSEAQYYLATIYLSDTLYIDSTRAIELLKKSAFQRNTKAIEKLEELNITEYEVQIDRDFWKRIGIFSFFTLLYLMLSFLATSKINKSKSLTSQDKKNLKRLTWSLPIIGSIISLKKSNKPVETIDKEDIEWIIERFEWIKNNFPDGLKNKSVKTSEDFKHIRLHASKDEVKKLVSEIASIMDIEKGKINTQFYKERQYENVDGIEIKQYENVERSTGKYYGQNINGQYIIAIEESLLSRPTNLIATITHELAHVKLLGENRISENDEYLTDLIPIAYGFGIFGANSIFNFDTNNYFWSMKKQGYLDERTYAFALAWFSHLRKEKNPIWTKELKPSMLDEFERNMLYIENEIKVIKQLL